jgi:plastocyanin
MGNWVWLTTPAMLLSLSGGSAIGADYTVVVTKMQFGPLPSELHVGDSITWKNDDIFRHSATAKDESFDVDLPAKQDVAMPLETAGEWAFVCKFHPGMTGTLIVLP